MLVGVVDGVLDLEISSPGFGVIVVVEVVIGDVASLLLVGVAGPRHLEASPLLADHGNVGFGAGISCRCLVLILSRRWEEGINDDALRNKTDGNAAIVIEVVSVILLILHILILF